MRRRGQGPCEGIRRFEWLESRVVLATKIVTIGDSWASFVANGAPGSPENYASVPNNNPFQQVLNNHGSGVQVYNGGFYGGTAAGHASQLADITAKINAAGPDVDIVYLSSGGNDFLAGLLLGGWYQQKPANEVQSLFDAIGNNVQTVVNHILSLRPDIQIVIPSYDYINMWDFDITGGGDPLRLNLGLIRSGNWTADLDQNATLNAALRDLENRKAAIAASSSRVHHENLFGYLNTVYGYQGYLSGGANVPPGAWSDFPVRPSLLGSSGGDPIHLNDTGYYAFLDKIYNDYLVTALQNGSLTTNTTTLDFGTIRLGTSTGPMSVVASNAGQNFTKVKDLYFQLATGDFSGGGVGANPLFKDPTLGSDTASAAYYYAPAARGIDSLGLTVSSSAGNRSLTLNGRAVGPQYSSVSTLAFSPASPNAPITQTLAVSNTTSDGNLGALTNLTITGASFSGPDGSLFQLNGFTPGTTVISAGGLANLTVQFNGAATERVYNATLTLFTDQGAAVGGSGQSFQVNLTVTVTYGIVMETGADPNNGSLTSLFLYGTNLNDTIAVYHETPTSVVVHVTQEAGLATDAFHTFTGITGRVIANMQAGGDKTLYFNNLNGLSAYLGNGTNLVKVFNATGGAYTFTGGDGNNNVLFFNASSANITLDGGNGSSSLAVATGSDGTYSLTGGAGNDQLILLNGTNCNLWMDGKGGDDTLIVGSDIGGSMTLSGGSGSDAFFLYGGSSLGATIDAGADDDTVVNVAASSTLSVNLGGGNDFLLNLEASAMTVLGGDGDDTIGSISGTDSIDGGAGNDLLIGGVIEGDGNDTILGGEGNDVIVGGGGADALNGGAGEDILIASWYAAAEIDSIFPIRDEWLSTRTYMQRVANISGTGTGPRLNGNNFLQLGVTVLNDASVDQLVGGSDMDWFLYGFEDALLDHEPGEQAFAGIVMF